MSGYNPPKAQQCPLTEEVDLLSDFTDVKVNQEKYKQLKERVVFSRTAQEPNCTLIMAEYCFCILLSATHGYNRCLLHYFTMAMRFVVNKAVNLLLLSLTVDLWAIRNWNFALREKHKRHKPRVLCMCALRSGLVNLRLSLRGPSPALH